MHVIHCRVVVFWDRSGWSWWCCIFYCARPTKGWGMTHLSKETYVIKIDLEEIYRLYIFFFYYARPTKGRGMIESQSVSFIGLFLYIGLFWHIRGVWGTTYSSKETYSNQRRTTKETKIYDNRPTKETYTYDKSWCDSALRYDTCVKRDLYTSNEPYIHQTRPAYIKQDL